MRGLPLRTLAARADAGSPLTETQPRTCSLFRYDEAVQWLEKQAADFPRAGLLRVDVETSEEPDVREG